MQNTVKRKVGRAKRLISIFAAVIFLAVSVPVAVNAAEIDTMSGKKAVFRYENLKLCVGGMPFGVKIFTEGVLVVGMSSFSSGGTDVCPATECGLKMRDAIISVNGETVDKVEDVSRLVSESGGNLLKFTVKRDGKEVNVEIKPKKCDETQSYKAGMWLRDSAAGIGTITFIDKENKSFGGLGHGICDIDTGMVMPLRKGSALGAQIGGVVKGKSGRPGELKGYFKPEKLGNVMSNTECGVFGIYADIPDGSGVEMPVGSRDSVKEGKAEIFCTLGSDGIQHYEISISKIDRSSHNNKSFMVTVTDSKLKERTGGIVQGMSGSPIIQNGKIIGAVTHVMVSDPSIGYGVFIENMLDAMAG